VLKLRLALSGIVVVAIILELLQLLELSTS
jgi:hypothetical protein